MQSQDNQEQGKPAVVKPDLVLSDGREIFLDLERMTIKEYRGLFDPAQTRDEESEILARVAGLTIEEYESLSQPNWRRLTKKFFEKARAPLDDPNSQSESTTT